jgi:hypothetical protein
MTATDLRLPLATRVPYTVRAAQALAVGPLGLLVGIAATAFTVSGFSDMSAGGLLVAAWAIALAVVNVGAGLRLGAGSARAYTALVAAALAQVAFGVVKLAVYHESASYVFMALDLVLLTLLARPAVKRFVEA